MEEGISMAKQPGNDSSGKNQGEGDRESARRFNEEEREFVESERGKVAIRSGPSPKSPEEERELDEAEKEARRHALENDPEESRDYREPS